MNYVSDLSDESYEISPSTDCSDQKKKKKKSHQICEISHTYLTMYEYLADKSLKCETQLGKVFFFFLSKAFKQVTGTPFSNLNKCTLNLNEKIVSFVLLHFFPGWRW